MKWDRKSIEEFLYSQTQRSINASEYELLIKFINKIKPRTVVDIGTYLGHSGYILGTCCDSIEYIFSIDNIDSREYYPKMEATKEEHGKYLPKNAVFLTMGYERGIFDDIINKHPNAFVFWDAGKNTAKVIRQLELSYNNNVKWIAIHDSGKKQRTVRRAIKRVESLGWYKTVEEDIESCPEKGVTIMERIE